MKHVFIIGSKGIPANYGGFETFVDKLTEYSKNNNEIKYYVSCKNDIDHVYNETYCFGVHVPNIGPAQAILYDLLSIKKSIDIIERNDIQNPIVYVLACRIGPFFNNYVKKIHSLGGKVFINPDGHEWKRAKWNYFIKKYWKYSEKLMVKYADLIICDSKNIEKYINNEYNKYKPKTTYIAYGSEIVNTRVKTSQDYISWKSDNKISNQFYVVIGRCVPENNYETIIKEFMMSRTDKDLVIISTSNDKLLNELNEKYQYKNDSRIKFVGTVYNQELLREIRSNAYAYIHGHSVGGTNPSLLEALGSTKLNLLYDVGFNREVAENAALYWTLDNGSLSNLINYADTLKQKDMNEYGKKAKKRIKNNYSWEYIIDKYNKVFKL